jgi:hypothetical protein
MGNDNPHDYLQYDYYTLSELIKKSKKRELFHNRFISVPAAICMVRPVPKNRPSNVTKSLMRCIAALTTAMRGSRSVPNRAQT